MRRKITIKPIKKKKRSLFSRVYWSRVGFLVTSATTVALGLLYAEERALTAELQESAWASDERMLLVQESAAGVLKTVRERERRLDNAELERTAIQITLDARWLAVNRAKAEVSERKSQLDALQRDLNALERDLDTLQGDVAVRTTIVMEREDTARARELELEVWQLGLKNREAELAKDRFEQPYNPDRQFRLGVEAYERGEFEAAELHFRNVLRSKPSHDQALHYRDEAGYTFWVRTLARGDRLSEVAKRLLRKAEEPAKKRGARVY